MNAITDHLVVLPIVLPALAAGLSLLLAGRDRSVRRTLTLATVLVLVPVVVWLLVATDSSGPLVYQIGDWPAPHGIVLVADRLSSLMLLLVVLVGLASLLYAVFGWDRAGRNFYALFLFQLAGVNGAFLTGDLFNLFVFFEVLLIASYALLLHGGGDRRLKAGLLYVVANLVASVLMLIAVGLVYGVTGTLNMAHLAGQVAQLDPADAGLLSVGALLLLVVFAVKAAVVPLHFWLPESYPAAAPPIAALFAIMTKVGAYAILRVFTLIFGADAGSLSLSAAPWLLPAAQATLIVGMLGSVASRTLGELVAWLLIASMGTLLTAFGLFTASGIAAGLYYMIHSTLIAAGLFLLVGVIAEVRGDAAGRFVPAPPVRYAAILGPAFLVGGIAIVGIPPLSGFVGKVMILQSAHAIEGVGWIYAVVLGTGLIGIVGCSRAGNRIFWDTHAPHGPVATMPPRTAPMAPALALIGSSLILTLFAGPIVGFTERTAAALVQPQAYLESVLGPVRPPKGG